MQTTNTTWTETWNLLMKKKQPGIPRPLPFYRISIRRNLLPTNFRHTQGPTTLYVENLLITINNIADGIIFAMEKEKDGQIELFDILLTRTYDGSIETQVYRKKTHTDQILNKNSTQQPCKTTKNKPPQSKRKRRTCLLSQSLRATPNIASTPKNRRNEKEYKTKVTYKTTAKHLLKQPPSPSIHTVPEITSIILEKYLKP